MAHPAKRARVEGASGDAPDPKERLAGFRDEEMAPSAPPGAGRVSKGRGRSGGAGKERRSKKRMNLATSGVVLGGADEVAGLNVSGEGLEAMGGGSAVVMTLADAPLLGEESGALFLADEEDELQAAEDGWADKMAQRAAKEQERAAREREAAREAGLPTAGGPGGPRNVSLDYYDEDEMAAFKARTEKSKKKKDKKKRKKRMRKRRDDSDEEEDGSGAAAAAPRRQTKAEFLADEDDADDADDADLAASLAAARRAMQKSVQRKQRKEAKAAAKQAQTDDADMGHGDDGAGNSDDEDEGVAAVTKAVRLRQEAKKKQREASDGTQKSTMVFTATTEFSRSLQTVVAERRAAAAEAERQAAEAALAAARAQSAAEKAKHQQAEKDALAKAADLQSRIDQAKADAAAAKAEEAVRSSGDVMTSALGEEPLVASGVAATLKALSRRGELRSNAVVEKAGRANDYKPTWEGTKDDPAPNIKLSYKDEFGREVGPKEAYRLLNYKFNGFGSGKRKQEKRQREYKESLKKQRAATGDVTGGGTMTAMRQGQKQSGQAHLVIQGGRKS